MVGWWAVRNARRQQEDYLIHLTAAHRQHLESKEAEIARLTEARNEEVKRLLRQLADAQKERKELLELLARRGNEP